MKITILIPVYNEAKTIKNVITMVNQTNLENYEKEILIVDDGSTDGTVEVISNLIDSGNFKGIKFVRHPKNKGKGAALKTGFKTAAGDFVVIQDADLEYFPKDIPKLIEPLELGVADVVYGSRFKGSIHGMSFSHFVGNLILTLATKLLFGTSISDMMTGYKCFRKKVLQHVKFEADRFEIEPDITGKVLKAGYKIVEVPIDYLRRQYGSAKINFLDGIKSLWWLVKVRFNLD